MKQRILLRAVLSAFLFLLIRPVMAQDFRGAVSGTVADSTGAVLPGVTVTITNVATNVASTTVTDERGAYQVRYLNAGRYNVQAQLEGLQTVIRKDVEVRIGATVPIDFTMEAGGVSEVMVVTASAPIIDTTTGVTGSVIDSTQIEQLPLGDGTAYMLTRLAPGVADSSDLHFSRPMDNGNLGGIVANGAMGGNDFTLDGAPNRVSPNNTNPGNNSGVVGFSPPSDAISQFKVQTNAFDAQSGHTAGATVNLALKSGTNQWSGSVGYFNRDDSRSATPLLSKRAGAEKPTREYNRYTATVAGPVIRDRTFFMFAYENLKDIQPESAAYTVPTVKMRNGDLSEWSGVTIYDPLTATGSNNARTAFAGNIIPVGRINPVAAAYAALYPLPNREGLEDNYFTNQLRPYDYNAYLLRGDHNFNGSHKLFLNAYRNKRIEDRYNWAKGAENATGEGEINGFLVTKGLDNRSNDGVTLGYTSMWGNSLALDVIGAWSRFGEWREAGDEFDPATLGFSSQAVAAMNGYKYLPFITFGSFSTTNSNSRIASLGSQRSDFGTGFSRPFTNISFTPTASWIMGEHSFRTGYELRNQRWEIDNAEYGAGRYHFNGAYTRANNSATLNVPAQSWAQFLLGLPTTGTNTVATPGSTASQFEIAADADYRQLSHSLFAQDDWSFNDKLTLNLGVRFEYHQAMTEAEDRNIAGFNTNLESPIAAAAIAKYAGSPIAEIPANAFRVNGGLEFADGPIYDDLTKVLPRVAFSYLIDPKTVIRGGVGLFSYDYYFDAGNQTGYSQPTAIVTTDNNGRTFLTDLNNPIPSGQLQQPVGSSLGAATGLGLNIGTVVPSEREVPYYTRWQLGGQRDLGRGWSVEAYYVNSKGRNLPVLREINGIPIEYLSTSTQRDTDREAFLAANVSNPFVGLLPGTGLNGTTITRGQLLRPYPQFLSIVTEEYTGSDSYQAGTVRVEKRFAGGNSVLATYTRSETRDKLNYLNPSDDELEDRVSPNDRPNRATLGATLRLPFGRNERYGSNWNPIVDAVLGGWTISTTYQYQSGFPLTWANNIYYDPSRDPMDLTSNIGDDCPNGGTAGLDCPAWDTSGFYIPGGTGRTDQRIVMGNTLRRFPSTLPNVRTDDLHLMDVGIYKNFGLPQGFDLQIRIEVINALNYTVLWNPNQDPTSASFGLVNQDRNNPRDIQLGAKLTF
ncbi:MAG TPA: TonB-dependent receptor [Thermoanaerobaculia bacterium]|nr:TonB-dependent receptor [Thermoanaerobaculia bacterium]